MNSFLMLSGAGGGHRGPWWLDFPLFCLAMMTVYPGHVIDWLNDQFSLNWNWRQSILVVLGCLFGSAGLTRLAMEFYPWVDWWHAAILIGVALLFRFIISGVVNFFGLDKWD